MCCHVFPPPPCRPLRGTKTSRQSPGEGNGGQDRARRRRRGQADRPRGRQGPSRRAGAPSRHEQDAGRPIEFRISVAKYAGAISTETAVRKPAASSPMSRPPAPVETSPCMTLPPNEGFSARKGQTPSDADDYKGAPGKFEKYFSLEPGSTG